MSSFILFLGMLAFSDSGYTPIADVHGVKVYKRDSGKGIDLAGEGMIDAPPEQVRKVLLDYEAHPKWNKNLAESKVLHKDADALDVYQRLDLPVLSDRDYTLHVKWGHDGDTLWLRFAADNDRGPAPKKGVVRLSDDEGEWTLQPKDGGAHTWARYHFRMNLGGSVPGWMGKGSASKEVPTLFDHVREQLKYYR